MPPQSTQTYPETNQTPQPANSQDITIRPKASQYSKYLGGSGAVISLVAALILVQIMRSQQPQTAGVSRVPAHVLIGCVLIALAVILGFMFRLIAHSRFSVTGSGLAYTGAFKKKRVAYSDIRRIVYIKRFSSGSQTPYARIAVNLAGHKWGSFTFLNTAIYTEEDFAKIVPAIEQRSGGSITRYDAMTAKQLTKAAPGTTLYIEAHPVTVAFAIVFIVIAGTVTVTQLLHL